MWTACQQRDMEVTKLTYEKYNLQQVHCLHYHHTHETLVTHHMSRVSHWCSCPPLPFFHPLSSTLLLSPKRALTKSK